MACSTASATACRFWQSRPTSPAAKSGSIISRQHIRKACSGIAAIMSSWFPIPSSDFALMAKAMGVRGIRVEKPQELKSAIEAALAHKGPVLVDVVSARQELAMPPRTTLEQAYHFGIFMTKAVLDGRATQLIDLAKVNLFR